MYKITAVLAVAMEENQRLTRALFCVVKLYIHSLFIEVPLWGMELLFVLKAAD